MERRGEPPADDVAEHVEEDDGARKENLKIHEQPDRGSARGRRSRCLRPSCSSPHSSFELHIVHDFDVDSLYEHRVDQPLLHRGDAERRGEQAYRSTRNCGSRRIVRRSRCLRRLCNSRIVHANFSSFAMLTQTASMSIRLTSPSSIAAMRSGAASNHAAVRVKERRASPRQTTSPSTSKRMTSYE